MEAILVKLFESFTTVHVTPDNTVVAINDDYVVLIRNLPTDEFGSVYQGRSDVSRVSPVFKSGELEADPEGSLLSISSYTEASCRLFELGLYAEDTCFVPTISMEVRTPKAHRCITASEQFGHFVLEKMKTFCTEHPEHVSAAIEITNKNLSRNQLIAFCKNQISIWIPRNGYNDANWLGVIHLDLKNNTFYWDFYDEIEGEECSLPDVWDELDLEKTKFFVDALIENPVLPRNKDGILY